MATNAKFMMDFRIGSEVINAHLFAFVVGSPVGEVCSQHECETIKAEAYCLRF